MNSAQPYLVISLSQLRNLVKIAERNAMARYGGKKDRRACLVMHPPMAADGQLNEREMIIEAENQAASNEQHADCFAPKVEVVK